MYSIIIDDSVFEDLETIYNFCKSHHGISYASKTIKIIFNSIYSLKKFPNFNPIYSTNNATIIRKKVVNKRYIIIFRTIYDSVYIYNIFDGRQNIKFSNYSNLN